MSKYLCALDGKFDGKINEKPSFVILRKPVKCREYLLQKLPSAFKIILDEISPSTYKDFYAGMIAL